jgi:hypothetical protein
LIIDYFFFGSPRLVALQILDLVLQLLYLLLVLLDDFLAEVRPLGQLLFNLLVVHEVSLQLGDPFLHHMVLVH